MKTTSRKWRRVYSYSCTRCGKERRTYLYAVLKATCCRDCRTNVLAENQESLFTEGNFPESHGEVSLLARHEFDPPVSAEDELKFTIEVTSK